MKVKQLVFSVMILLFMLCCKEEKVILNYPTYYWYGDEKIRLELNTSRQFILVENVESEEELRKIMANVCSKFEIDVFAPVKHDSVIEARNMHFATIRSNCYNRFKEFDDIYYVGPYFKFNDMDIGLTHYFNVGLKDLKDTVLLDSIVTATGVRLTSTYFENLPTIFRLAITNKNESNALEMANYFYETGLFKFAEPDFIGGDVLN